MAKHSILVAEFPYGGVTHHAVGDWLTETILKMRDDPRIGPGNVHRMAIADTPITMSRNRALAAAEHHGCDYCLMIDSDMLPDLPTAQGGKPFWESSWEFAVNHLGPCVVAAPYCGAPPYEVVHVFRWENRESGHPNVDLNINKYTRHEAARMTGIAEAAALATGLMLIDMRAVAKLKHPRFYYEWTDARQIQKGSTEDVTFSRDLRIAGVPIYCNWDAWAGHIKTKVVGKPDFFRTEDARSQMIEGLIASGQLADDPPPAVIARAAERHHDANQWPPAWLNPVVAASTEASDQS